MNDITFTNGLTDAQLERLAILSEELGEAQQAVGKIMRHGYESVNPDGDQAFTNRHDLEKELGDVHYAVGALWIAKDISRRRMIEWADAKADKIKPYLHHQNAEVAQP